MKRVSAQKILYDVNTGIRHSQINGNERHSENVHIHEEYQLLLITKGTGKSLVGEHVVEYKKGDILFIGTKVPHRYLVDDPLIKEMHEVELVQFCMDIFPAKMEKLNDFIHISRLLELSLKGILFNNQRLFKKVLVWVKQLDYFKGIERVTELYKILDALGRSRSYNLISNNNLNNNIYSKSDTLQRIYDYVYSQLHKDISLDNLAEYVNLNRTSLCRAFKYKTGGTIFQLITKLRIENACKLLTTTNLNISQIAFECGFNNISNFNRHFKIATGLSPKEFRASIDKNK